MALHSLASDLTRAVTTDEVLAIIAERAALVVGALRCIVARSTTSGVTLWRESSEASPSPNVPATLAATIERAMETGSVAVTDSHSVHPTPDRGGALVFEWESGAETDEQLVADVAALCWAAMSRALATRRAREMGAVMDSLLEQAPLGLAFIDTELRFVHLNQRLADINGASVAEHRGSSIREMVPDLAHELEPILRGVIDTGEPTPRLEITGETAADPDKTHVFGVAYLPVTLDNDEVVGIAAVVDDITEQKRHVDQLQRQYRHERDIAVRLQEGLTPKNLPAPSGYDVAARYLAGSQGLRIGGDWYDLIELSSDRYAFVIGDVVGHGLDAALAMVQIRHALAGLSHAVARPVEVLERLDEYATEREDRYVATLVYGLLQPSTGRIELISAGHPPPLIVTASGRIRRVTDGRGTPIGVTVGTREAATILLESGESLLLYTDGVLEDRGTSVDVGLDRLASAVAVPSRQAADIAAAVVAAAPGEDQVDDIALLVIRRNE